MSKEIDLYNEKKQLLQGKLTNLRQTAEQVTAEIYATQGQVLLLDDLILEVQKSPAKNKKEVADVTDSP